MQENLLILFEEVRQDLTRLFNNVAFGLYSGGNIIYTFELRAGEKRKCSVDLFVIDNNLTNELANREAVKQYITNLVMTSIHQKAGENG